jgi:hypothetical protein
MLNMINKPAGSGIINNDLWLYVGCSESKERLHLENKKHLRIQPAQVFHCTRSVVWCVQQRVDSYVFEDEGAPCW